ncbi:MAG TPA: nucleotidyl transferase AbiEii/AbiGii toxin family protein [Anaerolineae bacterium]|nr:nucleotidyl transferase AbiEii/AbiGii toxin family protein [Anaerolineae bacterium]
MSESMRLKAQIKKEAKARGVPAQAVLQTFMLERLVERVALSPYRDQIVLKGGLLIASMVGIGSRTTMDMDTTVRGLVVSEEGVRAVFGEICTIGVDDGVVFEMKGVVPIRADDEYGGFRASLLGVYGRIRTPLKVDVTTGDAMTPGPWRYRFPLQFAEREVEVWAYNVETILAEKLETIVRRTVFNTRPRDFYDVYILGKMKGEEIDRGVLGEALRATAANRGSEGVMEEAEEIVARVAGDERMKGRWERYCRTNRYAAGIGWGEVMGVVAEMLEGDF